MTSPTSQLAAAFRRHPGVVGLALAAVGLLMILDGVESGLRAHRFQTARQADATVTSVVEASSVPPRWDVALCWPDHGVGAREVVRVPTKRAQGLRPGDSVPILVSEAGGRKVILKADRPHDRTVDLGFVQTTPLGFLGLLISGSGLAFAGFGRKLAGTARRS
jgi:Protein of unknown function (DUF3592)